MLSTVICNFSSTQQNKSAPVNGKRAVPRKEEAQTGDGGKKQKSSAGPVKVAMVLKPIRGKSSNLKTNHETAAKDSAQLKNKCVAVSRTLSTSTSSLGSEVIEEGPLDSPRKAVQEVPDKNETTEGVETKHTSEDAHEESVEDQREGTGNALMTETVVEKSRNHSRVSTMSMFEGVKLSSSASDLCVQLQLTC